MNVKSFFTKVLLRLTYVNRKLVYRARGAGKKVLLSYVLVPSPSWDLRFFYRQLHNRFLMCKLMVETLNRLGYDVYLYDYLNTDIDYSPKYDLFIGHNRFFADIARKLPSSCSKVLLTTGCSAEFDNAQLRKRNDDVKKRRNTTRDFFTPINEEEFPRINCRVADHLFMIGSEFIRDHGWYPGVGEKAFLYNNVTLLNPMRKEKRAGGFIFMSSNGQLRRGLDLVLQAFAERKEKIFICGPYALEPAFVEHFRKELFETPNIIPMGFVDQSSVQFRQMLEEVDFAILPSCSEGQSGSLLTLMAYGLIPIAPDNVGFQDIESLGVRIGEFSVEEIHRVVENAVSLSDEIVEEKRDRIFKAVRDEFTPESFKETFRTFINKTQS